MTVSTDTSHDSYLPQDGAQDKKVSQSPVDGTWWAVAAVGIGLMVLSGFVIYETLGLFASGASTWLDCTRSENAALVDCGTPLETAYTYRFGLDALQALGAALIAAFLGPIPLIAVLNRYQSNWAGVLMFLLVMLPYGLLAFLILVLGTLVIAFYGIEVV